MNFVENNGKKVAAILCVASAFPVVATVVAAKEEPGWHGDRYVNEDKTVAKGWQEIEGKSYYFSENGTVNSSKTEKATTASVSSNITGEVKETVATASQEAVKEVVEEKAAEVVETPAETTETPADTTEAPAETPAPEQTETPAPEQTTTPTATTLGQRISAEAQKLVGVTDGLWCTQVVQQALANAGVSDAYQLWPDQYCAQYGYYTDSPAEGDLIYYNNGGRGVDHIAIYIGNGQAVHGNYDGKTVIAGATSQYLASPQYIRVNR